MRLFIYGSCVSRDALEFQQDGPELVKYVARTSLAVQQAGSEVLTSLLERLPSPFQREMMLIDMGKSLFEQLESAQYDVLLLDFIDERFGIAEFTSGARYTLSAEFLTANTEGLTYTEINRFSAQKFQLWCQGFEQLMQLLNSKTPQPAVVVNRVYFTGMVGSCAADCSWHEGFTELEITRNNNYLKQLYEYIEQNHPQVQFIDYAPELLIADKAHKWGIAPFHYIAPFYHATLAALKPLAADK